MRIDDNCREEVMMAVKEQVDVEVVNASMKEILSRGVSKVDEEVVAILEPVLIANPSELSHCLDTLMALKCRHREIAALLSCKSDDVIDGIEDLIAEKARLSRETDE
ncbi:hypothetical protein Y032_0464g1929 [Ancylostoma ceylanicum]|uniref:Uncharacterized protein n=1 Tax=Ancylostoma ceylanicum TaxID=53326 RepID=A0A016WWY8_9BILA|nr:hypothetical protein Y032_0464g1929 [Ancylostoma ceylanicum]